MISTQARGGAQARARRRRRVVALRARRHGPRAAHVGGPGAFPASFLFLCLRPCGVALATRTWGGYGAAVEAAVRRYIQMKCLALLDGPFVVGHNGRVVRGKNAAHHERRPSPDPSRWPSTTRHRRRRGTSSASSSGRSTARRRRPRTAGCTARATRYVFRRPLLWPGRPSFAELRPVGWTPPVARAGLRRAYIGSPTRERPPKTPSTRPATKNAGETRRQGEAGPRARAEVQGGRREGVRQARAERRAARGRVGGHDGVRGPCLVLVCLFPSS